jgi:hypothetical protein
MPHHDSHVHTPQHMHHFKNEPFPDNLELPPFRRPPPSLIGETITAQEDAHTPAKATATIGCHTVLKADVVTDPEGVSQCRPAVLGERHGAGPCADESLLPAQIEWRKQHPTDPVALTLADPEAGAVKPSMKGRLPVKVGEEKKAEQ